MVVLLPEGRAISNPDSIKMVKIIASEIKNKKSFVVVVKIDDDSEVVIKTCQTSEEAIELSDLCTARINDPESGNEGAGGGAGTAAEEDEDDDSW
jgi:hypothetical protein